MFLVAQQVLTSFPWARGNFCLSGFCRSALVVNVPEMKTTLVKESNFGTKE
jgi:hypothetical protein